jgi:hypothetical protein
VTRNERQHSRGTRHSEEGDECTIRPGETRTVDLAAEYGQLMGEYQDLRTFGDRVHPVDTNGLEDASEEAVEEGQGHGG